MRTRGEPVFAFIDRDVSDQPFHVDRVPFTGSDEVVSLVNGLLGIFMPWGGGTPATVVYVTDPAGTVYEVGHFGSAVREAEWIERARGAVVDRGAAGMADMSDSVAFRQRYGTPVTPDSLLARSISLQEESKRA